MAERDWERRYPAPAIDASAARAIVLEHLRRDDVTDVTPMEGGKINVHARIAFEDGDAVVLRARLGEGATLPKEAALLAHFGDVIPVPHVLGAGRVTLAGEARDYLLLTWTPGASLDTLLPTMNEAALVRAGETLGRAMACVHAEVRPAMGFLNDKLAVAKPMTSLINAWGFHMLDLLGSHQVRDRLGPARRRALKTRVHQAVAVLHPLEGHYTLLHGDCKPVNIRAHDTGTLTGLLDWEFAWSGPPLSDWGQLLRWPLPPEFEAALIDGYRSVGGVLEGAWREQARTLDLMNLISFLDWDPPRERVIQDTLALLDQALA